jgi:glycosyltransferase involved in cell wall biosynthesis
MRYGPGQHQATISLIIPAKNEAKNLPYVLPLIPEEVDEVIVVDGESTDGTLDVARELRPDIRIVNQTGKGKGNALRAGFATAAGDIIVMIDADGSTDPREIPMFISTLMAGADFVKGSRFMQGGGSADITWLRKMGNWGLTTLVKLMYGGSFTDLAYGYAAFWRHIVPPLELDGDGFEIETMLNVRALRSGVRVAEVPSFEAERIHGESNLNTFRDGWRVLKTILREKVRPQQRIGPKNPPAARLDELPTAVILPDLSAGACGVDWPVESALVPRTESVTEARRLG